jgi:protein-disulfide isomerase
MTSSKLTRFTARCLTVAFAAALAALPGCNNKPKAKGGSTAAAPSGSSSAGLVATGPCADYAKKVCEKAGDESPACSSFKTATEVMTEATCQAGLKDIAKTFTKLASLRGPCDELVKQLCAAVGDKTETCTMVKTQTKNFPPERCKMMQEHIPQIVGDLKKMEASKQPLTPELASKIAAGPVPSVGPENASVQIVEFSDFECPFCSRAANVVHQIREKYGDKVRIVFRQFPLAMHPNARAAAEAALAAHSQGKFWPFHDLMFKNQQALDRPNLEKHAKESGLDVTAFKKSLDDKKFAAQVDADMKLGEEVSVQGTPTMFINGKRVDNPTDFAAVASLIDSALGAPPG